MSRVWPHISHHTGFGPTVTTIGSSVKTRPMIALHAVWSTAAQRCDLLADRADRSGGDQLTAVAGHPRACVLEARAQTHR